MSNVSLFFQMNASVEGVTRSIIREACRSSDDVPDWGIVVIAWIGVICACLVLIMVLVCAGMCLSSPCVSYKRCPCCVRYGNLPTVATISELNGDCQKNPCEMCDSSESSTTDPHTDEAETKRRPRDGGDDEGECI